MEHTTFLGHAQHKGKVMGGVCILNILYLLVIWRVPPIGDAVCVCLRLNYKHNPTLKLRPIAFVIIQHLPTL